MQRKNPQSNTPLSSGSNSSQGEVIIKNQNRVEKRSIAPYQNEYDRLGLTPVQAGASLLPSKKSNLKSQESDSSSDASADVNFVISKASKRQNSSYEYESQSPGLPFQKAPQQMWATLDAKTSWEADESDSEIIIEKEAPQKFVDNNDYVDVESSESINDPEFQETSGLGLEDIIIQTESNKYVLFVKNQLVLENADEQEIQQLIESIIYGDHEDFKNVDLKASDFSVFKKMELYFGASIVG